MVRPAGRGGLALRDGSLRRPAVLGGVLAAVAAILALVFFAVANRPLDPEEIARRARPSTATVVCGDQTGSGFFVEPELLVTNAHVLCASGRPRVTLVSGVELEGRVRSSDDWLDLAAVEVPGAAARPLAIADASPLVEGERIMIIGAPRGLGFSVHSGALSNVGRSQFGIAYLQFDGSVNPGNSGGPMLDSRGRVVGIVTMMISGAQGLGFALPANYLRWGDKPVVPELTSQASKQWLALMDKVALDDATELERVAKSMKKPALVGAMATKGRGVTLWVMLRSDAQPRAARFEYQLVRGETLLCAGDAPVAE